MRFHPTFRNICSVSLPMIVAGVGETIIDVTDALFLAHYGVVELGAVALADALLGVAIFAVAGLVDGLQIMMGRRAGEDRPRALGEAFNQGVYLLAIVSITLTLLLEFGSPYLTALVVSSGEVRAAVDDFIQVFALATFFQAMNLAYSAFYCGIGRTRVLVAATVVLAVINIVLDYGLIFGNLGLPELGIQGAATGSLCAEFGFFAFITGHVFVRGYHQSYGLFRFRAWSRELTARITSISWPVSLEALVESLRWFVFFVIVEQLGESALATANIVYSCYAMFLIPIAGFAETACTMVSNLIGQCRSAAIPELLRKTIGACALIVLPLMVAAMVFSEGLVSIFAAEPEIVVTATAGLRFAILALFVIIPATILAHAVAGTGDTAAALLIELASTAVILIFAAVTAFYWELPAEFIWLAEFIGGALGVALALLCLHRARWTDLEV